MGGEFTGWRGGWQAAIPSPLQPLLAPLSHMPNSKGGGSEQTLTPIREAGTGLPSDWGC